MAKYFTMEHQVQNAPMPMKISVAPRVKGTGKMAKSEPKMEHRFPVSDTIYQPLTSLAFSLKLRFCQERCYLW